MTRPARNGDDSDEKSWESLGQTRVIEEKTPPESAPGEAPLAPILAPAEPTAKAPVELGDYQLLKKIGEGAMGAVYKARHKPTGREVALKVLFPHIAKNPRLVERLHREGLVMGQLDHPNIVQAYGIHEIDAWHFIEMEFVEGQSMQKWLAKLGRLSIGDALHVILACARALEYAHNQGIVHRDIKPDNILITRTGGVKVTDLGMVKIDDEDMALTQTGHAVGTPWYMPLEQAKNAKDTDRRSDIYALGCMLYCFLTGMPPFAGKTLLEVIQAKEAGTFPPARQANPDVPEKLDLIIIKMTAKLPKYRYQSCAEVIHDLEALQLASPTLTFLDPNYQTTNVPQPKVPSSHDDTRIVPVEDPNVWYVRIKDSSGKVEVRKLVTTQVQTMLAEDLLAPNTKASHHPKVGFRALATYKEFQAQALVKASRQSADQHAVRYRTLYKKIEQQVDEQERDKSREPSAAPRRPMPPWFPLVVKIGAGVIGAIVAFSILYYMFR
ncbi:MAG: serine/threonine protein kinase [Gemmataceae bacterium]|nr:serine/threonine protein kinase [Gemmataceae bacterium]